MAQLWGGRFTKETDQLVYNFNRLLYLVDTQTQTIVAVAFAVEYLLEVDFVVEGIGMAFAHIARPARGTACAACASVRDCILFAEDTYIYHSFTGDGVVCEDIVVFLQLAEDVFAILLHFTGKAGSDVCLHTADGVVVLYQAASGSRFEDVENLLAVTETIEESSQGTQVHAETREEQQV